MPDPARINHHLTESLLLAYATGELPEAFSIAVAAHLSLCDECRARSMTFDVLGGALLETHAEVLSDGALAATLARVRSEGPAPTPRTPVPADVLPAPVRGYVGGGLDAVRWRPLGGGVKQAILYRDEHATARLLSIAAGAAVPDHGHAGTEITLVLAGAFSDGIGRFGPGDVELADEDVDHQPVADPGGDCICLAATDARLRFHSFVPRLAGQIFGI
ncbi:Anti-sigma factor ChrR [Oceanicola granulosus HTCC2516]|uniref:Anti-sigma factor ChrR n=1 Tax=Oceanicola granulosus (strain ATCC BAA-861 / DSM 15982 / KCTC 12143 / HTCC2516) TaxID=314256 RepID=Q2CKE2_OCEGH|nr:ChrR family anti-sigma-E factor [Oceanicola granulosus]EAR52847.1 Anti-sigma factor ChrR [Oceanicola granulosus HTCC2516]